MSDMIALQVTQDSIAARFVIEHGSKARFDHHAGKWFLWNGTRWAKNENGGVAERCRILCRECGLEAPKQAKDLGKHGSIKGVELIARNDPVVSVTSEIWDCDAMLLGTPAGTVDLRTGALIPAKRADHITRQTAVAPGSGDCPLWKKLLREWCKADQATIDYLQILCGYCLTGMTIEHILVFLYGPGGNGKSVWLNTIAGIMGDYATTAPMETFVLSTHDQHPTSLAGLKGARLVSATETEEGRRWAEARIKQITGGDTISARFMRQNFFEFRPNFKLVVIGNHKPILRNVDEATKRRFHMIPFIHKPEQVRKRLEDELKAEWPQILAWMVEGAVKWHATGLAQPAAVAKATKKYFDDEDTFGQWVRDKCEIDRPEMNDRAPFSTLSSWLYQNWQGWCTTNGEVAGSQKRFSQEIEKRGFFKKRNDVGMMVYGIRLKPKASAPQDDDHPGRGGNGHSEAAVGL